MSSTGTRPPLFDPEPGGFDDERGSGRQRGGARPGYPRTRSGGSSSTSPRWVRPFILGGLVLIALISLASIFGGGGTPSPAPAADPAAIVDPAEAGDGDADAADPTIGIGVAADTPGDARPDTTDPADTDTDRATDHTTDAGTAAGAAVAQAAPDAAPIAADPAVQAATAFAVQFAHDYLNYDEASPEAREQQLRAYLAPDLDPQLGWGGQGVQIAVLTVPVATEVDGDAVVVTVASHVSGAGRTRWVHLAVALSQDDRGRWAVVAPPAYVPRPAPGTPEVDAGFEVDQALSGELTPAMTELFRTFAAEREVDVAGITAPGSAIRGLGGQVAFSRVDTVRIRAGGDDAREGLVTVTWDDDETGGTTSQRYRIQLVASDGGWLVESIDLGVRNP